MPYTLQLLKHSKAQAAQQILGLRLLIHCPAVPKPEPRAAPSQEDSARCPLGPLRPCSPFTLMLLRSMAGSLGLAGAAGAGAGAGAGAAAAGFFTSFFGAILCCLNWKVKVP